MKKLMVVSFGVLLFVVGVILVVSPTALVTKDCPMILSLFGGIFLGLAGVFLFSEVFCSSGIEEIREIKS